MNMIKALLKALFPRVFLKKAFLAFNKAKIKTLDRILFPAAALDSRDFLIQRETNPFLALDIDLAHYSNDVQDRLKIWIDPHWTQDEYLFAYKKGGYIEPKVGWGITIDNKLIYPSLGFSHAPHVRKPNVLDTYFYKKRIVKLKAILSLRDTGEENYFHFFNDVVAKLYFIRDAGLDPMSFTIVISKKLFDKEYFKVMLQKSWLNKLNYHVQQDEWIQFENAVFCKPLTHSLRYFKEVANLFPQVNSQARNRRVFITRAPQTLRFIENMHELQPIFEKYGFEIIDSAKLPFNEQVKLFSECRILVGVHGAGLTNMIFRYGSPLSVLEIAHPFEYIPFHYIMLAKQFQFEYNVILGKKGKSVTGGFWVDPNDLEVSIGNLITR